MKLLLSFSLSALLVPMGFAIAATALRDWPLTAFVLYVGGWLCWVLCQTWAHARSSLWLQGFRQLYLLIVLSTLHALGSCPQWFLALMIASSMLSGFLMAVTRLSPSSFHPLPEVDTWNRTAQLVLLGVLLLDFVLVREFPAHFRASENFHFTCYLFLASLQLLNSGADFYRLRKPMSVFLRALTPSEP